jgi:hypothetical protein
MHTGPGEMDSLPAWRKIRGRIALYSDTNDISLGDEFGRRYWDCYEHYVLPRLLEGDATGLVLLVPPADTPEVRQANLARLQKLVEGWTAEPMPPAPSAAALPTDL